MSRSLPSASRAVVTVSFGSSDVLPVFLGSIDGASTESAAVVVADNRPEAEVERIARSASADYLPLPANPGYGGAINAAVATLPGSVTWVLVANPDVVLSPAAIDRLVATAETDERIASVGPRILTPAGDVYPSARRIPSIRLGVGHAVFGGAWPRNPWTRRYRQDADVERRDAGWLSGSCFLIRRAAFDAIGGFDEQYFMYFEDVDLGFRLGRAGYRNVYEPDAVATHVGGHSTERNQAEMLRAHHRSAKRFIARKYAGWVWWPVRVALGIGLEIRSAVAGLRVSARRAD
jgi:N-acetylglucosaminyl-diphospho-decaprenol L-rhamnosyltransferase